MAKPTVTDYDFENIISIDDELPLWSAPFGLKLLEHVNYKPDLTALDIGFGSGFPLIELALRLGKNARVYGIDPWKKAVERTNEKIRRLGITNITVIEGPAEDMPLDRMTSTIQKHGFLIRDLEHDQFQYAFADGTAMMNHHKIRSGFMQSWIQFLPPDRSQQILDEVEHRLNQQARLPGKLTLSIPFVVIDAVKP